MRLSIMALNRSRFILKWFRKKYYTVKDLPTGNFTVFETEAGELVEVESWSDDNVLYVKFITGPRIGFHTVDEFPADEKLYPLIRTKY